jgi:hypothetical protein
MEGIAMMRGMTTKVTMYPIAITTSQDRREKREERRENTLSIGNVFSLRRGSAANEDFWNLPEAVRLEYRCLTNPV